MQTLRKQIKESFFNPILHLLPLLIYLVVNVLFGMDMAWKVTFPIALGLLLYVYFVYNRIFTWHLIFTLLFFLMSIIAGLETLLPFKVANNTLIFEIVVLVSLLVFVVFKKQIQKTITTVISDLIPMSNNFEELYRMIWFLIVILFFHVSASLIIHSAIKDDPKYFNLLQNIFIGVLFFVSVLEILRVQIIRSKLIKEEWWPIVSNQGKIIGSIQHLASLNQEKKYMHPVVRVILIDKSMVLLEKKSSDDPESPDLWDTSISNHVRMGETIEKCVERSAEDKFALNNFKFMYLSNYTLEGKSEHQYAFLFVSCLQTEYKFSKDASEQTKWWTQRQIEDNLEAGIFTENFKLEFDLLQRSGLLESGKCECACRMRDIIYQQTTAAMDKSELN